MIQLFLAQTSTLPVADDVLADGFKLSIVALLIFLLVLQIRNSLKPNPSNEERFAGKDELRAIANRVEKTDEKVEKTDEKIDQLRVDVARNYSELQKSDEARTAVLHSRLDGFHETLRQISEKVGGSHA